MPNRGVFYFNLGQCVGEHMCYFRSTDIEQNNWHRLLWSVPDEMLFHLSIDSYVGIIDKSTKAKGKIERIFVPVLSDLLREICLNEPGIHKNLKGSIRLAKMALENDTSLLTKFKLFQGKIKNIRLNGYTIQVETEPNYVNYNKNKSTYKELKNNFSYLSNINYYEFIDIIERRK